MQAGAETPPVFHLAGIIQKEAAFIKDTARGLC